MLLALGACQAVTAALQSLGLIDSAHATAAAPAAAEVDRLAVQWLTGLLGVRVIGADAVRVARAVHRRIRSGPQPRDRSGGSTDGATRK